MAISKQNTASIVRAYGKRLFGFIRPRVSSDADAEDVMQDVWYQFARIAEVAPIEQIGSWLFRVARNRITDLYRKRRNDALEDYAMEDEDGDLYYPDVLLTASDTPESEFFRQLFWEELFAALDELPEAQRDVFVWNELEDQTLQEIADRTGDNIKTLISRKRYAVQHLRRRLDALYREFVSSP